MAPAMSAALYWPAIEGLQMLADDDGDVDGDGQLEAVMLLPFPHHSSSVWAPENTPLSGFSRHDLSVPERLPAVPDKVPVNAVGAGAVGAQDVGVDMNVDMNVLLKESQATARARAAAIAEHQQLPTNSVPTNSMNQQPKQALAKAPQQAAMPQVLTVKQLQQQVQTQLQQQVQTQSLGQQQVQTQSLGQQLDASLPPAVQQQQQLPTNSMNQQLPTNLVHTNSMNQQLPARARAQQEAELVRAQLQMLQAALAEDTPGKGP